MGQFESTIVNVSPHILRDAFRRIEDPRRIVGRSLNPTRSTAELTWLGGRVSLQDKRTLRPPLSADRRTALHVPYIGVLQANEREQIIVVQGDRLLAKSPLFARPFKGRLAQPPFHAFILGHAASLIAARIPDSYTFAPAMDDPTRYGWWIGREQFVDEAIIGTIGGRPIQYIRVWGGQGLIAANGTDTLYFMWGEDVLAAAIANRPLTEADWNPIYATGGEPIWFMAAAFTRDGQEFMPIQLRSARNGGRDVDVELRDPDEMIAVFAAEREAQVPA